MSPSVKRAAGHGSAVEVPPRVPSTPAQPAPKPAKPSPRPIVHVSSSLPTSGWQPGAPPHITEETLDIDRRTLQLARCERCDNRGLEFVPYHNGERYAVLGVCCRCGEARTF